jgi:hypothetical protein
MAGRDAGPTRALLMGIAGLRAGDWRTSGTVGLTVRLIVGRALVLPDTSHHRWLPRGHPHPCQ